MEHNNLHHYKLGEVDGDPDLVEKNLVDLREKTNPLWLKYAEVGWIQLVINNPTGSKERNNGLDLTCK